MSEIVRNAIEKEGVIAIVRKLYGEPLMKLGEALYAGGVTLMEVTFDQSAPDVLPKTAAAISELYGVDVKYCSNRKEAKDHGDAGILLGSPVHDGDRVLIIEDVTTSGKSIEETVPILKAQGNVQIVGLMVSLNRCEKGKGEKSALEEVAELYGFPTAAIVTMEEVTGYLENKEGSPIDSVRRAQLDDYYRQYGAAGSWTFKA